MLRMMVSLVALTLVARKLTPPFSTLRCRWWGPQPMGKSKRLRLAPQVFLAESSSAACQFFFGGLSVLTVPSRHADVYGMA
jgi:hypothetical protein